MNKFHIIGVGPGDPELMTVKAVRLLNECSTLVVPKGKVDGDSTALKIASGLVDLSEKEIVEIHFPMKKVYNGKSDPNVHAAWQQAAESIRDRLGAGNVVFPTLGDPAVYSTAFYVSMALSEVASEVNINIVPGITAMSGCSAEGNQPLCLGNDVLSVVPATFEDDRLREILSNSDSVVLMKVYNVLDRLIPLLKESDLLEKAVLYEKCGMEGQKIHNNLLEAAKKDIHYFSTIVAHR